MCLTTRHGMRCKRGAPQYQPPPPSRRGGSDRSGCASIDWGTVGLLALVTISLLGCSLVGCGAQARGPGPLPEPPDDPPPTVEPSDAQLELNALAVQASREGDNEKAIDLFTASLALGDLNVTWLNLGRAYATAGQCEDALEAYDTVPFVPRVPNPPHSQVHDILVGYRDELIDEQCAGTLDLACEPPGMEIFLDDRVIPCPDAPMTISWGEHELIWSVRGRSTPVQRKFMVEPGSRIGEVHPPAQ